MLCTSTQQAVECYSQARRQEPWRLDGLDAGHFSSALWQLRRDTELAALSRHVQHVQQTQNRCWHAAAPVQSADGFVTAGNCFSLQKEHELALKSFKKVRHWIYIVNQLISCFPPKAKTLKICLCLRLRFQS
jgi:hypothetical protein